MSGHRVPLERLEPQVLQVPLASEECPERWGRLGQLVLRDCKARQAEKAPGVLPGHVDQLDQKESTVKSGRCQSINGTAPSYGLNSHGAGGSGLISKGLLALPA